VGQLPVFYNHKPSARRGYLFDTAQPLYPFGYGLSYTRFDISAPRVVTPSIAAGQPVQVEVDVANTGPRVGDEVVQLYVRDDEASVTKPVIELKRFQRITLAAGERKTLGFDLKPDDLATWNPDMKHVVEPGTFTIYSGPNSIDLKPAKLTVTG
jgi:beta-glucosidase